MVKGETVPGQDIYNMIFQRVVQTRSEMQIKTVFTNPKMTEETNLMRAISPKEKNKSGLVTHKMCMFAWMASHLDPCGGLTGATAVKKKK